MTPRILVLDIETAPLEGYVWDIWEQNVGLDQIKAEWSILSYCAKWLEEKSLFYEDTGGRGPKKVRDDKRLMKGLWELLDEADIVVAQNGAEFDVKKINARLIVHGYKPYSPIRVVDTFKVAKKHFRFTSNKLAWMSQYLTDTPKSEHKQFPGFELWKECLADNPKAWAEMKKYNQIDVLACEKVYLKQRPWITGHPNVGVYIQDKDPVCPKCKSKHLQQRGYAMSQAGSYTRFQCMECGGWAKGRFTQLAKEVRRGLVTN
jgi:hypothetical protein